ncbi:CoA transferase subunit A [Chloroflexota bacterium]
MAINKIFSSFDEAVADIFDGAVILLGGFGPANGCPSNLIRALAKQGAKNLTLVANTPGHGRDIFEMLQAQGKVKAPPNYDDGALLVKMGQVKKAICSFPFSPWPGAVNPLQERFTAGEAEIEMVPQGTLAERIRAAKAGISAFFTPTGIDTLMEQGKETRLIEGRKNVLEYAIKADFALIKAHKADRWGNLVYKGTARNFNAVMAGAAKITIAEVDQTVALGELDSEAIVTPAIYVNRVVVRAKAGKGA